MGDIIIGGTLHSAAVGNTVARTDEILDSTQNKKQNVVNAETAQHLTNIDETNTSQNNTLENHEGRLGVVEGLGQIMVDGGTIGIATAEEILNPTEQTPSKVPTVGALNNLIDDIPVEDSDKLVRSGGVYEAYAHQVYLEEEDAVPAPPEKTIDADTVWNTNGNQIIPAANQKAIRNNIGVTEELALGGVYDVTAHNGGATFASLSDLLSNVNLSTLIPAAVRKGGMSIKFVHTSDNKYVQFRLIADAFTTDVTQWQGVDEELMAGSKNLINSGCIFNELYSEENTTRISHISDTYDIDVENSTIVSVVLGGRYIDIWGPFNTGDILNVWYQTSNITKVTKYGFSDTSDISNGTTLTQCAIFNPTNTEMQCHQIECEGDGKYLCVNAIRAYVPLDSISVKYVKNKIDVLNKKENQLNIRTGVLEGSVAFLQEQTVKMNTRLTLVESNFVKTTQLFGTEIRYIDINRETGVIISGVQQRRVLYYPVTEGEIINVNHEQKLSSDDNRLLWYGYTTVIPTVDVSTSDYGKFEREVSEQIYTEEIVAPITGYLCLFYRINYVNITTVVSKEYITLDDYYNNRSFETLLRCYKSSYDGQFLNIAYSVMGNPDFIPRGNTLEFFTEMLKRGFNGLKADMRLTSDGKIILCHDKGFTLDANGRITTYDSSSENTILIHDYTFDYLTQLEYSWPIYHSDPAIYYNPCSLEKYLRLCKAKGCIPYITLRNEYLDTIVPEFYRLLKKYNLVSKVIINLFSANNDTISVIRHYIQEPILICNTLQSNVEITEQNLQETIDYGCKYICINAVDSVTDVIIEAVKSKDLGLMAWTNRPVDELIELGYDGCQQYLTTNNIDTIPSLKNMIESV